MRMSNALFEQNSGADSLLEAIMGKDKNTLETRNRSEKSSQFEPGCPKTARNLGSEISSVQRKTRNARPKLDHICWQGTSEMMAPSSAAQRHNMLGGTQVPSKVC